MSRWDALRPERRACPTKKSFQVQRPSYARRTGSLALDWHVQLTRLETSLREGNNATVDSTLGSLDVMLKSESDIAPQSLGDAVAILTMAGVEETRRLEMASHILKKVNVLLTNLQVKNCFSNLISCKDRGIECLALLVMVAYKQMPPEETAHQLVGNTLIPVLENPQCHVSIVLEVLQRLIRDPLHASALLAPLTLDVTEDGEEIVTNPLRKRLMRALQSLLPLIPYSRSACACIISIVTSSVEVAAEIDLSILKPFFVDAIRSNELGEQRDALELLRVVLKTYPTTSATLSNLLIGDRHSSSRTNGETCSYCQYHQPTSPLLDLLHGARLEGLMHALPCVEELLQAMPLHIWLGNRPSTGLQHFGQRTLEALVCLIRVVQCRLQQGGTFTSALSPLIEVLLTRVPYSSNEKDILIRKAIQLFSSISQLMRHRRIPELIESFVNCMGGRPRPQGGLTTMAAPMRAWLLSASSLEFWEYLWSSVKLKDNARKDSMQILCAVARTLPSAFLSDRMTWERFQRAVVEHITDSSHHVRLDGVTLLEKLLMGRIENVNVQEVEGIALFASSIARAMLKDEQALIRTVSLNCYGSLLTLDWPMLSAISGENGEAGFSQDVNIVLSYCVRPSETSFEGEAKAGVRSAACKSIGDICTQFLAVPTGNYSSHISDEQARTFCRAVCDAAMVALQDPNVGVRSMAVFAIGNLAHAVRNRASVELFIPPLNFQPLFIAVYNCLPESNDKVAGNAIRTIGHLVSLAFHPPYRESGALDGWDAHTFYGNVLKGLDSKIKAALRSESCAKLSWKQRSVAKKHAWGACNSLALALDCDEAATDVNLMIAQDSFRSLVQCMERAGVLNEKVTASATAAIRKISDARLSQISSGSGLVGMAMAPCLVQLYLSKKSHRPMKNRLGNELELLLRHLLGATTIFDASYLLKQDDIEKSTLEFLYDWMVESNMPLNSFESFALALQRKDLMDDVAVQQKFASRALQIYRSADGSLRNAVEDTVIETTADTDEAEDEL